MDDAEFRDLQERVQLIKEIAASPGWQMLVDRASATMWSRQNRLLGGRLESMEEYKAEVAFINGMRYVLSVPDLVQGELDEATTFRRQEKETDG